MNKQQQETTRALRKRSKEELIRIILQQNVREEELFGLQGKEPALNKIVIADFCIESTTEPLENVKATMNDMIKKPIRSALNAYFLHNYEKEAVKYA